MYWKDRCALLMNLFIRNYIHISKYQIFQILTNHFLPLRNPLFLLWYDFYKSKKLQLVFQVMIDSRAETVIFAQSTLIPEMSNMYVRMVIFTALDMRYVCVLCLSTVHCTNGNLLSGFRNLESPVQQQQHTHLCWSLWWLFPVHRWRRIFFNGHWAQNKSAHIRIVRQIAKLDTVVDGP